MELMYTQEQQAFRSEVRSWLAENVPTERLPSFDTAEGFEAHREWERTLPKELGHGDLADRVRWARV